MIVYKDHWLTLRWDESLQAAWAQGSAYAEGAELRPGYDAILALCRSKQNRRYIGDARDLAPISPSDQRWINEEFMPKLIAAGVRFMAVVIPRASVARLSVRQVLSRVHDVSFVTAYFDDLEAARDWLRTV
ncbi:MAG: hypothetical protein U1A78_17615 [Polyangia bacterium]